MTNNNVFTIEPETEKTRQEFNRRLKVLLEKGFVKPLRASDKIETKGLAQ